MATTTSTISSTGEVNVFFFYPNLIGYGRIGLALLSFFSMTSLPAVTSILYFLSAFLDAFDGYVARLYNQGTRFGAMLDQLTDRCAFLGLLMALCRLYPSLLVPLQLIAIVDISSHWMHLHATVLTRAETHKSSKNPILHFYYTSKPFLFFMCFGNEAFFGLLYANHFWSGPTILFQVTTIQVLAVLFLPIALVKSVISVIHLVEASRMIADFDKVQTSITNVNKRE